MSVVDAISEFEMISDKINPIDCRNNALNFSREVFKNKIEKYVEDKWFEFKNKKAIRY